MTSPVRDGPAGAELDLQVVPRASRSRVVGELGGRLKVQLAAPPVDGAANAALIELLADALAVPRADLDLVRGHTGKRKTVRVAGLAAAELRRRLGLAALGLASLLACTSSVPVPVRVVLPEETAALQRADNAAVELAPQGLVTNFDIDGVDFSLELELEPDAVQRTLALYLADGETLLAWGRSAPFLLDAAPEGLALYVSPPGELSTFPGEVAEPDPALLVAPARGRGAVLLDGEGRAALFNEFTLATEIAATLEPEDGLPDPADGALVPDAAGGVWRLAWADGLRAFRYDPADDAWSTPNLAGDPTPARPGAAWLVDAAQTRVLVFGGGERTDIAQLDLLADDAGEHALVAGGVDLDAPRRGATARYVVRADGDDDEGAVLVGGDDPARPLAVFVTAGAAVPFGPAGAWTGLQCAQLDPGEAGDAVRVLCVGGVRDGAPTGAALVLHFPGDAADMPTLEEVPDLLPDAPEDPRLFADPAAIYAQYAAQWVRIDRADLTVALATSPSGRVRGGHSVPLGTGATFLVGGYDADDRAVDRWHVFVPTLDTP
jgi:hypothetical protein